MWSVFRSALYVVAGWMLSSYWDSLQWLLTKFWTAAVDMATVWFTGIGNMAGGILAGLAASYPSLAVNFAGVLAMLEMGNHWFPIAEVVSALFVFWGFLTVFIGIKLVLKIIPFVG